MKKIDGIVKQINDRLQKAKPIIQSAEKAIEKVKDVKIVKGYGESMKHNIILDIFLCLYMIICSIKDPDFEMLQHYDPKDKINDIIYSKQPDFKKLESNEA